MNHDASIRSQQEFERDNNELIANRDTAQLAFDEAYNTKTSLEAQIVVLEDLKYTVTNEAIIEEIDAKIREFIDQITESESVIE